MHIIYIYVYMYINDLNYFSNLRILKESENISECDLKIYINHLLNNIQYDRAYVYSYLITVRLQNAEDVPPENSQRHSLEQEITLALILKSHGKSAAQIFKKLDRRFPHGAGRLDSNWLEDEASAYLAIFLTSAVSATDPAARIRFEDANVLTHVVSQMRQRPHE